MFKVLLGRRGNTGTCDLLSPADVEVGSPHIHWLWGQISTAHKSPFHAFYSRDFLQYLSRLFPIGFVICYWNYKPSRLNFGYLCFGSRSVIKTDAKMWQTKNISELWLAIISWIISRSFLSWTERPKNQMRAVKLFRLPWWDTTKGSSNHWVEINCLTLINFLDILVGFTMEINIEIWKS